MESSTDPKGNFPVHLQLLDSSRPPASELVQTPNLLLRHSVPSTLTKTSERETGHQCVLEQVQYRVRDEVDHIPTKSTLEGGALDNAHLQSKKQKVVNLVLQETAHGYHILPYHPPDALHKLMSESQSLRQKSWRATEQHDNCVTLPRAGCARTSSQRSQTSSGTDDQNSESTVARVHSRRWKRQRLVLNLPPDFRTSRNLEVVEGDSGVPTSTSNANNVAPSAISLAGDRQDQAILQPNKHGPLPPIRQTHEPGQKSQTDQTLPVSGPQNYGLLSPPAKVYEQGQASQTDHVLAAALSPRDSSRHNVASFTTRITDSSCNLADGPTGDTPTPSGRLDRNSATLVDKPSGHDQPPGRRQLAGDITSTPNLVSLLLHDESSNAPSVLRKRESRRMGLVLNLRFSEAITAARASSALCARGTPVSNGSTANLFPANTAGANISLSDAVIVLDEASKPEYAENNTRKPTDGCRRRLPWVTPAAQLDQQLSQQGTPYGATDTTSPKRQSSRLRFLSTQPIPNQRPQNDKQAIDSPKTVVGSNMDVEPMPPWASQLLSEAKQALKKCAALEATVDEKNEELKKQSESFQKQHRDVQAREEILRRQQQEFFQLLNRVEMLSSSTVGPAIDASQCVNQPLSGGAGEIQVSHQSQAVYTISQSNQLVSEIIQGPGKGSSEEATIPGQSVPLDEATIASRMAALEEGIMHQQHGGSNKRGRAIDYEDMEFTSLDPRGLSSKSVGEGGSARRVNRAKPARKAASGIPARSSTSKGAKFPADKV